MGFLSGLKKALPAIGGIVAAPFTGGASLLGTLGSVAGAAAPIIGGMAAGRAQGKQAETNNQAMVDQLRQRAYEAQSRNALDLSQLGANKTAFEASAPNNRFQQA